MDNPTESKTIDFKAEAAKMVNPELRSALGDEKFEHLLTEGAEVRRAAHTLEEFNNIVQELVAKLSAANIQHYILFVYHSGIEYHAYAADATVNMHMLVDLRAANTPDTHKIFKQQLTILCEGVKDATGEDTPAYILDRDKMVEIVKETVAEDSNYQVYIAALDPENDDYVEFSTLKSRVVAGLMRAVASGMHAQEVAKLYQDDVVRLIEACVSLRDSANAAGLEIDPNITDLLNMYCGPVQG